MLLRWFYNIETHMETMAKLHLVIFNVMCREWDKNFCFIKYRLSQYKNTQPRY